jgi:hypothetical protein
METTGVIASSAMDGMLASISLGGLDMKAVSAGCLHLRARGCIGGKKRSPAGPETWEKI